ncbi:calcium-binding protein [Acuticoccus kandeliae]|uniref:calcium-binding protein n=1 Tax=Acuticoccus kandeliae TaxID=2073160 RepID=UPI0014747C52|nr:calcium-binding protein [Acuticoccus kandeliae]
MDEIDALGTTVWLYIPGATPAEDQFIDLTAETGRGFGDPHNKYTWGSALFDHDGDETTPPRLYVGTLNAQGDFTGGIAATVRFAGLGETGSGDIFQLLFNDPTSLRELLAQDYPNVLQGDGPEIWEYDSADGGSWQQVFNISESGGVDDDDLGFRDAVVYDGKLFIPTSTQLIYNIVAAGDNPAKIIYTTDGTNYAALSGGPLGDPETGSIRSLETAVIDGKEVLVVGTENSTNGAELWVWDGETDSWWPDPLISFDGDTMDSDGADIPFATAISETYQAADGRLLVGTWFPYKLYEITPEGEINDVTPLDPSESPTTASDDQGVMQIITYDGYLYVGSVNYTGGASLYRAELPSGADWTPQWEVVTTAGFSDNPGPPEYADGAAPYVWQLTVIDDVLYIGDSSATTAHLLRLTHDTDLDNTPILEVVQDPVNGGPMMFGPLAGGLRKFVPVAIDPVTHEFLTDQSDPNAFIIGTATPFASPAEGLLEFFFGYNGETVLGRANRTNQLEGGALEDLILGGAEIDIIHAGAEDDTILSDFWGLGVRGGRDEVHGGAGDDLVLGGRGNDSLYGDENEDFLIGGKGRDSIHGGEGTDFIVGDGLLDGPVGDLFGSLSETFSDPQLMQNLELPEGDGPTLQELLANLTEASAAVRGLLGMMNDTLHGDEGSDIIIAGAGRDRVYGGEDGDLVYGLQGNDKIFGEAGDDILDGGAGRDFVSGGDGNDVIVTGLGNDTMLGGEGSDRFLVLGGDVTLAGFDTSSGPIVGDGVIETGRDRIIGFEKGVDVIDLSAFMNNNPLIPDPNIPVYSFADHIQPALSASALGWLVIDLSLIKGNADNDLDDVDGAGTIIVVGLRYADVEESDFKVDTQFTAGFDFFSFI